jgi:hypothetical protein
VGGTPGPWCEDIAEVRPGRPFWFTPDGRHVAWIGRYGGAWRPVVDASIGPGASGVSMPRFRGLNAEFLAIKADGIHRVATALD